jgi:DNA-binding transcriptional ArsR family regulator
MATPATSKQLPSNIDAERCILGAVLLDKSAIATAETLLSTTDFFFDHHRKIWKGMLSLAGDNLPIDLVILAQRLQETRDLESAGGTPYLASLADGMPRVSNVEHYAKIVKDAAERRSLIHLADKLQERAWESEGTLSDVVAAAQERLAAIKTRAQTIVSGNGKLTYSGSEFVLAQFPEPEHLIPGLIPKNGSAIIIAMPHNLKTWFTLALAIGPTRAGMLMGKIPILKPVRTLLVTVEDFPGEVQWRVRKLLSKEAFKDVDMEAFRVLPRPVGGLDLMEEAWMQRILKEIESFKADHVIFDVLRRLFRGDINSPQESSALCEQIDRIRDDTGVATTVVHHENRRGEDIMRASAGSFNFPAWANVIMRFQRKVDETLADRKVSHVEIEVDNKLTNSPEPVRMFLDLDSESPLRLEELEDLVHVDELRNQLGAFWTIRDLTEVLDVHRSSAKRRLRKLLDAGIAEKVVSGKRGMNGGLARYKFVSADA